jgi:hypothetical protein
MKKYKDIVKEVLDRGDIDVRNPNDDILLISSDYEYKTVMKNYSWLKPGIMVDVRPDKNRLIVSYNFWETSLMMKLTADYLLELRKYSLPEPKEIYILDIWESNITIGWWDKVFNKSFYQPKEGYVEQLMYRCRELTDNTTVSLVNADINSYKSSLIRKVGRFDNYYSFPFGILYRTKSRLRLFKEENSIMNYQASPSKHFICMNANPIPKRIDLVNYLHKEKIINICHLSWLGVGYIDGANLKNVTDENAQFDYSKRIILDFEPEELRGDGKYETVPKFYYLTDSLIDIGIETHSEPINDVIKFITEKTWKSYLFGKVGFQYNYPEYYSDLKTFGFELYDEIFDYSFDKIEDHGIRFKEYCKELKRISGISIKELTEKIITIEGKILNNRNHAWNYEFPRPTILKEYPNLGIGLNE